MKIPRPLEGAFYLALLGCGVDDVVIPPARADSGGVNSNYDAGCIVDNDADCSGKCGQIKNSCGTIVDCGTCAPRQTCGGGGAPNVCGTGSCAPTCAGKACGASDGCSGTCPTGTCSAGLECLSGVCACDTTSCTGCCSAGECVLGTASTACGAGGAECTVCSASQACSLGSCAATAPDAGPCQIPQGTCAHSLCTAGSPLVEGCDPTGCTTLLCVEFAPACCTSSFADTCVLQVEELVLGGLCGS